MTQLDPGREEADRAPLVAVQTDLLPGSVNDGERSWPMVLDDVTGALETLTAVLDTTDDFTLLLRRMCEQLTRAVPGVEEASITLVEAGSPRTAATSSELIVNLDRDQYEIGDGPCIEAARTGQLVKVDINTAEAKWPAFARSAKEAGVGSFLCAPIVLGQEQAGAVNGYSVREGGFADLDIALLELYTTAIEAILRTYRRYVQAQAVADQLQAALDSRATIDQAKGVLMAAHQIDAHAAFAMLVEQSQRENLKLRDLALRLLHRVTDGAGGN